METFTLLTLQKCISENNLPKHAHYIHTRKTRKDNIHKRFPDIFSSIHDDIMRLPFYTRSESKTKQKSRSFNSIRKPPENSQDYAQKPQRNCMSMNSASV
jgi:hypothetical protein